MTFRKIGPGDYHFQHDGIEYRVYDAIPSSGRHWIVRRIDDNRVVSESHSRRSAVEYVKGETR